MRKAQGWLCMCQMRLQPQGRKPTIKSLMICFGCCNKWIIGSKSAARVSEEGITERARFALSQRDREWRAIQGKGISMHKAPNQERTPCLRNNKELGIFERAGQEMKQGAWWTPHNQEYPISYRKWALGSPGRFFKFKVPDSTCWRNAYLQVWGRKYARWACRRHFVTPKKWRGH